MFDIYSLISRVVLRIKVTLTSELLGYWVMNELSEMHIIAKFSNSKKNILGRKYIVCLKKDRVNWFLIIKFQKLNKACIYNRDK